MAQDNSKQSLFEIIKDKVFFSRFNDEMAVVVENIPDECEDGKVYFNGMTLVDGIENCEDDIQQVYSITKQGKKVNLEDYYSENGAYAKTGEKRFIEALDNLMTRELYEAYTTGTYVPTCVVEISPRKKKIQSREYEDRTDVTGVVFHDKVTEIGASAFNGCTNLKSVTLPESLTKIASFAFMRAGLETIDIPSSVEKIGNYSFAQCIALKTVNIASGHAIEIGNEAFFYCTSLTHVTLPDTATKIGNDAFRYCTSLQEIHIPNPDLLSKVVLKPGVKIITD